MSLSALPEASIVTVDVAVVPEATPALYENLELESVADAEVKFAECVFLRGDKN